jgi:hypothetical protein
VQELAFLFCKILALLLPSEKKRRSLRRFLRANSLPAISAQSDQKLPEIEVLYVATEKDFEILKSTLPLTLDSLSNYRINSVTIVVPDNQFLALSRLLLEVDSPVNVVSESSLVSQIHINQLQATFGERYGWVLQQILKLLFVKKSSNVGVLVVDADTALLTKRTWIDSNYRQVLCPTWENHDPYYQFLEEHGIPVNPPEFTFVSHHMLFQPNVLNEILTLQGWDTTEKMINNLLTSATAEENSPFSIDYELYAQYLYLVHPEKVLLEKWANYEASPRKSTESIAEHAKRISSRSLGKYASVSFHSYLN